MILHLLFVDKFGEYAIKQFSGFAMHSEFVIVTNKWETLPEQSYENIRQIKANSKEFDELLDRLKDYNAIIIHGLFHPWQAKVLKSVPSDVKVAWVFWGADLYGREDIKNNYLSLSSKHLIRMHKFKYFITQKRVKNNYEIPYELLNRIDYCLTDIHEDYTFAKEYIGNGLKELWYNYYSVEDTIGDLALSTIKGEDILIGNSCTIECNHLDAFHILKKFKLPQSSKLIVPLSYGEPWLRKKIMRKGKQLFKVRFSPLVDFLPRDDYNQYILGCAVAIMPHYRPQAFGNILTALWLGCRVYLSERNPLYSFFKRKGILIYSMEKDLKPTCPDALKALSEEQRNVNRGIISSIYSKEVMHQKNLEIVIILDA